MCGIAGVISKKSIDINLSQLQKLMSNRGPDSFESASGIFNKINYSFYFSRLSIIDLDKRSNQPFKKFNNTIVFNGEIYNYLELKKDLEKKYKFYTNSDTEVLLTAYEEYGEKLCDYIEGMWSFVIFDSKKEIFFISNDPFGEKPLYYFQNSNTFIFSSELNYFKTLNPNNYFPNVDKVKSFLYEGYKVMKQDNSTFIKNIYSFPPSQIWQINKDFKIKKFPYWKIEYKPNFEMSYSEAKNKTQELIENSIKIRSRADVNVGISLSGGIDSCLMSYFFQKNIKKDFQTFTVIDEDQRYNEEKNVDLMIEHLNLDKEQVNKIKLKKENFISDLKSLVSYHSAPVQTISSYINSLIGRKAKDNNVKVMLSGLGADELYLGYYNQYIYFLKEKYLANDNFEKHLSEWNKNTGYHINNPHIKNLDNFFSSKTLDHIFSDITEFKKMMKDQSIKKIYAEEEFSSDELRNRMLNDLKKDVVPIILNQEDLNYMYSSVENRCPFLDRKLAEFSCTIPNNLLVKDGYTKYILRDIGNNLTNLKKIFFDSEKKGFNASILSVFPLNEENKNICLSDSGIFDIIDKDAFKSILEKDFTKNSYSKFLFAFLSSKLFLDSF
jgi:asparagine synthase (glutamine-hydrolysing)